MQVCRALPEDPDGEIGNLLAVKDRRPKYALTLDEFGESNIDGVRIMPIIDFLLT